MRLYSCNHCMAFADWYRIAIGRLVSGVVVGALSVAVPTVCYRFGRSEPSLMFSRPNTKLKCYNYRQLPDISEARLLAHISCSLLFASLHLALHRFSYSTWSHYILNACCISIGTRHMFGSGSWRTVIGTLGGDIWRWNINFGNYGQPDRRVVGG